MQPDAYHRPLMFRTIHSVYCIGPSHPGGVTSGQRPGPSFFVKSTRTPPWPRSSSVIVAVAGQFATSAGEFMIVARPRLMASFGAGPVGGTGEGTGAGTGGVEKAAVTDQGPIVSGSAARTCQ